MAKRDEPPRAAYLATLLARTFPDSRPHLIALAVGAMQCAAARHRQHGVNICNYNMTERSQKAAETTLVRLAKEADDALMALGGVSHDGRGVVKTPTGAAMMLVFGGDPRGPCGRLVIDGTPGDGFGDGFAIYE